MSTLDAMESEITDLRTEVERKQAESLGLQMQIGKQMDESERLKADAARLNFLDRNLHMKMGWQVGKAPAGNLSVTSIIYLGKPAVSIRAAIDAAMPDSKTDWSAA